MSNDYQHLSELAHVQHGKCAVCLVRACSKPHITKDIVTGESRTRGLLCEPCHELVSVLSLQNLRDEYAIGRKRQDNGEVETYRTNSGRFWHDLIVLRWAVEYMEEIEGVGPDDPTLFHPGS